ncbi:NAD-dependent epimerase/dehydratase family protein [Fluviicola sp.]|jgi:CDP-paratose 2-epimerase|uniref:NAD-dependent epimerase/dehydratase family protein n=1 Tax=Fluviicola sp. TaxID=1917219 RepID=UPI0028185723|nr:NAD-dependent epimerase/dehydratase family protein [Fluviicola sp.]MDR0802199.1 NAD-dependent epimerase/dehydratase family protein [Fluviicola sp.]
MNIALITGSGGLIGSESVIFCADKFDLIIGIDNDMRSYFFGSDASTQWNVLELKNNYSNYKHYNIDIRNYEGLEEIFSEYGKDIKLIIHSAAQPSHDWAAKEPLTDFGVNATGTLNMLELCKNHCPESVFIFTSTNKVYGDNPNLLPLVELEKRWEIDSTHPYFNHGIDEQMSLDHTTHSIFGASKVAADVLVQEYGRYFNMNTAVFRGGCLTGPNHSGAKLHGFLSYLVKCNLSGEHYTIFGYKGKQVRDNIHSYDLVNMFWHFYQNPRKGEVYNAGGSRFSNCSMIEAIEVIERISGNKMNYSYTNDNRIGDHIWYISDIRKFQSHYPDWKYKYDLDDIISQIHNSMKERVAKNV